MPIPTKEISHLCVDYRIRDAKENYHQVLETNNILESDPVIWLLLLNLAQLSKLNAAQPFSKVK